MGTGFGPAPVNQGNIFDYKRSVVLGISIATNSGEANTEKYTF
jgi:hypothetical protein